MGTETELKLQLDPAALLRVRRLPAVQRLKRGRPLTRFEESVYFDTPELHLRDQKTVLRVRHIGRRRIQTVKTTGDWPGVGWARREWEWEISGDEPELLPLRATDLADLFADDQVMRQLRPVFSTEIHRTIYRLGEEDWEVELALDDGRLVAGERTALVSEAELELKAGDAGRLFTLALELHRQIPARLVTATKSERAFGLLDAWRPTPQKAAPITLTPDMSAGAAFRCIARSCVGQLLANQDCLHRTHDPEAVHQMRVALRRLRSAMSIFNDFLDTAETVELRGELRWLGEQLGPARDAQVFIEEIIEPLTDDFAELPGFALLRGDFEARRQAAEEAAIAMLAEPRFTEVMIRLGQWSEGGDWFGNADQTRREALDRPARAVAAATLGKRDNKVRKGMRHLAESDPAARHRTRIQLKKLRYAVEFFHSLYERKGKRLAATLGELQDRLGLLNDIAVSASVLKTTAERLGGGERLWAAGMMAGWHAARVAGLLKQAKDDWKSYDKLPRFWPDSE